MVLCQQLFTRLVSTATLPPVFRGHALSLLGRWVGNKSSEGPTLENSTQRKGRDLEHI